MPVLISKYLNNVPPSDPYGDEDGFDVDIDLEWRSETVEPEEEKEVGEQFNSVPVRLTPDQLHRKGQETLALIRASSED